MTAGVPAQTREKTNVRQTENFPHGPPPLDCADLSIVPLATQIQRFYCALLLVFDFLSTSGKMNTGRAVVLLQPKEKIMGYRRKIRPWESASPPTVWNRGSTTFYCTSGTSSVEVHQRTYCSKMSFAQLLFVSCLLRQSHHQPIYQFDDGQGLLADGTRRSDSG